MKRRTAIKVSLMALASTYALAYDKSKIVNTKKESIKEPGTSNKRRA